MTKTRLLISLACLTIGFSLWTYPWSISPDVGAILILIGGITSPRPPSKSFDASNRAKNRKIILLVAGLLVLFILGEYLKSTHPHEPWSHFPRHAAFAIPLWACSVLLICRRWNRPRKNIPPP